MNITSDQIRNSARFGTSLRADTINKLADQQDELLDAMAEFCRRVEAGEIRSRRTYGKFKALLAAHGRTS